ncbi:MAG: hypothetical protein ACOY94_23335 [Bacillota bacterium]
MLVGFAGAVMMLVVAVYLVTLPDGSKSLSARTHGGTWVDVSYRPGEPDVRISLRLEGLSRHSSAVIKVTSSEPWAPTWNFQIEGAMSEFLSLGDGYSTAPEPMTKALAERVARSYKVTMVVDGEERSFDFSKAQITEPLVLPTLDVVRFRLQR